MIKDLKKALNLIEEVYIHTAKVNDFIKDTGCIPDDGGIWQRDEKNLKEALEILQQRPG
jgi:hypothetical protein